MTWDITIDVRYLAAFVTLAVVGVWAAFKLAAGIGRVNGSAWERATSTHYEGVETLPTRAQREFFDQHERLSEPSWDALRRFADDVKGGE